MECTQRLECTQDLYETQTEKRIPEQIGFLGICGAKHPIKRGPNKIGRDPQTCSIVLNLNSISRQHAVINVLSHKEFMLMDLDSANKTKLMDKTLPAYIPHPLKNGDMVQFGDIFGVFRLLEEDDDMPMTQAIDVPETPVTSRHMSKINKAAVTTIPESPDVSDREESFIAPSQPKGERCFKNSNSNHFIKPSAKVISIQPIGSNKIDNVYWNSSKKSVSLSSQFNCSLNSSTQSDKNEGRESNDTSIFDMETQPPTIDTNNSVDSIYTANTQAPDIADIHNANTQIPTASPSIHTADTQIPTTLSSIHTADTQIPTSSPTIHNADTQIPTASSSIHSLNTQLPPSTQQVCKIDNQQEFQLDLYASNKSCNNIFEADTQLTMAEKDEDVKPSISKSPFKSKMAAQITKNLNVSDEVILFDDIDGQQFEGDFASQPLLPSETNLELEDRFCDNTKTHSHKDLEDKKHVKKDVIIHSDSSTDCEDIDILPIQKNTHNKKTEDEDLTDCEDLFNDEPVKSHKHENVAKKKTKNVDFEDMPTQIIDHDVVENKVTGKSGNDDNLEDMLTQVIILENDDNMVSKKTSSKVIANINMDNKVSTKSGNEDNLEDMLTQVIVPEKDDNVNSKNRSSTIINNVHLEDMPTQIIVADGEIIISEKQSVQKDTSFEDMPTQVISETENTSVTKARLIEKETNDFVSPFKIPLISPIKVKRKVIKVYTPKSKPAIDKSSPISVPEDDANYYAATQDILDDLCTQRMSSEVAAEDNLPEESNDDFLPSSVEDYEFVNRLPHLDNLSPTKKQHISNKSSESSDGDEKVNNFVSNLSSQQVRDIVGIETQVSHLKRVASDSSDIELTPKKVRPIKFMDIDLPSSQEIKTSVSVYNKSVVTESSSESEVENDSEECTPILFRKKKKTKVDAKVDLTKIFEAESLPTKIITRVRKPTLKLQNGDNTNKSTRNILKPKYLAEQEDDIDNEIITENLSRLKSKSEKSKNKDVKKKNENSVKDKSEKEAKENTASEKIDDKSFVTTSQNKSDKDVKLEPKTNTNTSTSISKANKSKEKAKKGEDSKNKRKEKNTPSSESKNVSHEEAIVNNQESAEKIVTSRSTRSTRNRKNAVTVTEKSPLTDIVKDDSQNDSQGRSSRRQNNKKPIEIDLTEEVVEVRRSGRQRTSKEKKSKRDEKTSDKNEKSSVKTTKLSETSTKSSEKPVKSLDKIENSCSIHHDAIKKPATRRGRAPKHEQSTVYSLSSDSGADTPRNGKRSATTDLDPPSPKRTRSAVTTNNLNTTLRSTPARMNKTHHVLFTAFPCEEVKAKLEKLGAVVVSDVSACTVVLTMAVKRTFKLLCAVGLGKPIVGPNWVQACVDTNMIVDPWLYILKDEAAEKRFQFNLERTLMGKRNFLKGYNVSATPSVMPSAPEMKLIVESSGGSWREAEGGLVVSCGADRALWAALRRRGATLVSTEFILGGVLKQRADVAHNKLH